METLPASQDDPGSSGNNPPSSVKSDDSSPRQESGRGSPPPNCAICLGTCKNKSFTDSCLHQFCFNCLLTWSKVKAECPLCKQNFKSIIHNVRSNHQYEEYYVEQRAGQVIENVEIPNRPSVTRRFRYRTTVTLPRRDTLAIQEYLLHHYRVVSAAVLAGRAPSRRRRDPASFRRTVYRHNLWARPLPDFTGRFRDCSPEFYRYNDSQMHRLVPWINRELQYLLNENIGHISYVLTRILELLPQYHINSPEFRESIHRYFGDRTEHFLHELYCFASTPYDLTGYDRNVQYTTDSRISQMVNEIISSSESDASVDSDIVMISHSEPADAPPGPSRVSRTTQAPHVPHTPAPVYPHSYIPNIPLPNTQLSNSVIPIETISHSDTDDDDEVMVVGYIKPPQDRTPEVVDLLGSDSDVVVQETPQATPSTSTEQPAGSSSNLVRLSLKTPRSQEVVSSDECLTPPPPKRPRSNYSATTDDTWRATPSPARSEWRLSTPSSRHSTVSSVFSSPSFQTSAGWETSSDSTVSAYTSSSSDSRKKRPLKKRFKRKSYTKKDKHSPKKDKKKSKKKSRSRRKEKERPASSSRKSQSGKGVKSSRSRKGEGESRSLESVLDQPGTSGTNGTASRTYNPPSVTVNWSNYAHNETFENVSGTSETINKSPGTPNRSTDTTPKSSGTTSEISNTTNRSTDISNRHTETINRSNDNTESSSSRTTRSSSRRKDRDRNSSRESHRLRSVVNVMRHSGDSNSSNSSNLLSILSSAILKPNSNILAYNSDSGSVNSEGRTRQTEMPQEILDKAESCFNIDNIRNRSSDSDDDFPLNLSVHKTSQ